LNSRLECATSKAFGRRLVVGYEGRDIQLRSISWLLVEGAGRKKQESKKVQCIDGLFDTGAEKLVILAFKAFL